MTDQYLAEIRLFAGNFAPLGWAFCNGQILSISQNTALFSLLGTNYGGNGTSNFALPNLQGLTPLGTGFGAGLTPRSVGETAGEQSVTLQQNQMAAHNHLFNATVGAANSTAAAGNVPAEIRGRLYGTGHSAAMSSQTLGPTGGSQPHNNMAPYLSANFIIALTGIFPPRG